MMRTLRTLGVAVALCMGLGVAGCAGEAQLSAGTPPPPPPPPSASAAPVESAPVAAAPVDDDPDKDGIKGEADKCPNEPETFNGFQDEDGCPDTLPRVQIIGNTIKINEKIMFADDKADIKPESDKLIEEVANTLKSHSEIGFIEIAGHADKDGADAHNKTLTQNRAKAVMAALTKLGVEKTRMRAAGYSSYCPMDQGTTDDAKAKNRRVEFKILKMNDKETGEKWGGCEEATKKGMKPAAVPATPKKVEKATTDKPAADKKVEKKADKPATTDKPAKKK